MQSKNMEQQQLVSGNTCIVSHCQRKLWDVSHSAAGWGISGSV